MSGAEKNTLGTSFDVIGLRKVDLMFNQSQISGDTYEMFSGHYGTFIILTEPYRKFTHACKTVPFRTL